MKVVRTLAISLLTLLAWSGLASSQAPYTSHAAGVAPRPVVTTNSAAPEEIPATSAFWTKATTAPAVSVGSMLLLTDGRVLVHEEPNCGGLGCVGNDYSAWYTLTPDNTGSYINGTWTKMASLPSGYTPLFFGSAVLADGKVVVQGGEYNCPGGSCSPVWQSKGTIYDPVANTWTATIPPANSNIGDAQSVVLPDGTWLLAECCAIAFGRSSFPVYYSFNESTLSFTQLANASDGKFDDFDEEGWNLLPNNLVLTVDAYTTNTNLSGTNSETYNSSTNKWSTAGSTIKQLWDSNCKFGNGSFEVGPAVLRPDGTVFATGSSDCSAGHTSVYDSSTGVWTAGPDFPNSNAANDAPAALETSGNVIVEASPFSGTFSPPAKFYEWDGTNLNTFPAPPNAVNTPSFVGHLLGLPNGQIMYTDFTTDVEFLTPAGTYNSAWQPTITTVPSTLVPGTTVAISGTQFNGLSEANSYGDDFQDATNYPLVRIVNNATGHVFYGRTHGHSAMGVATGSTIVSTNFDVPAGIETGASELFVVANGIPSAAAAVTVSTGTGGSFTLAARPKTLTVARGSTGSVTIRSTISGGFDSAIALTAAGLGSGVSVRFNPSTIPAPGSGTSAMTIKVSSTATTGTRTIKVRGTGGGVTKTISITLTIT